MEGPRACRVAQVVVHIELTPVPLLERLRALYDLPRDTARFRRYIHELTGGGDEMLLPIAGRSC